MNKREAKARLDRLQFGISSLDLMKNPIERKRKKGIQWNHGIRVYFENGQESKED